MVTIVLDYSNARVKIFEHPPMQIEDLEVYMYEKYKLSDSNIEWMTVEKLEIEELI